VPTVNEHLKGIYAEGELAGRATIRKFRIVRTEGKREVAREIEHYNPDAILAVGFRVRSHRGKQYRQWAIGRLNEYLVKGFTMDDERLKNPTFDAAQAIAVMLEKHGIACDLMHGFNWDKWITGKPTQRLALIPAGQEHILEQEDGKKRWVKVVTELSRAFAPCAASDEATAIRDEVCFFQALQAALNKQSSSNRETPEQIDAAIRQFVSKAITNEGQVIDVFTAAGLPKPDISILSDQFLDEVLGLKHKNVAAELLEKLLKDELKVRSKRNLVQSQVFSEKLKKTLNAYHNRAISTMKVIEELIRLAKELDAATKRAEDLGLTEDEIAFYDALATNESAVRALGVPELKLIAAELITSVRKSVTIDWTLRESARAKIRVIVKRILRRYGFPPDLQEEAVKTVLAQAELVSACWANSNTLPHEMDDDL
jgi:type I restriction enzyme, R subunit